MRIIKISILLIVLSSIFIVDVQAQDKFDSNELITEFRKHTTEVTDNITQKVSEIPDGVVIKSFDDFKPYLSPSMGVEDIRAVYNDYFTFLKEYNLNNSTLASDELRNIIGSFDNGPECFKAWYSREGMINGSMMGCVEGLLHHNMDIEDCEICGVKALKASVQNNIKMDQCMEQLK